LFQALLIYRRVVDTHARGKLGDATKEIVVKFGETVSGAWYSDNSRIPASVYPWFIRGGDAEDGDSAGLFLFYSNNGTSSGAYGSRSVVVSRSMQ